MSLRTVIQTKRNNTVYTFHEDRQRLIIDCDDLIMFDGWISAKSGKWTIEDTKESCEIREIVREKGKMRN